MVEDDWFNQGKGRTMTPQERNNLEAELSQCGEGHGIIASSDSAIYKAAKAHLNNMGEAPTGDTGECEDGRYASCATSPAITDEQKRAALAAVNAWFASIEWTEKRGTPFKYKDSEEVLYYHGETIRTLLQAPSVDREVVEALEGCLAECKEMLLFTGGCEHEVGVCCCVLIRRIDHAEQALTTLRRGK